MTSDAYSRFKIVKHFSDDAYSSQLEKNLVMYMQWSLLSIGAWSDVEVATSGIDGGDFSRLVLVDDPQYTDGQVWQSVRKDWVWETGVNYVDATGATQNPVVVGTPVVNGVATSEDYHVNYPLGRIVFDDAISTSAVVKVQHAYRNVQVYRADDVPWYRQLQFYSHSPGNTQFINQSASGDWSIGGHHRIQMPSVIIEAIPKAYGRPFEIGNGSINISQTIKFHILAENRTDRNKLVDYLVAQTDKTIWLFDTNELAANGDYPLDYRGELVGSYMYPDFVAETGDYRWKRARFAYVEANEIQAISPDLYEGVVTAVMETTFGSKTL